MKTFNFGATFKLTHNQRIVLFSAVCGMFCNIFSFATFATFCLCKGAITFLLLQEGGAFYASSCVGTTLFLCKDKSYTLQSAMTQCALVQEIEINRTKCLVNGIYK